MTAFPLLEAREANVESILALLDDGELTPELEAALDEALRDSEQAILDVAGRALDVESQAAKLAEWRKNAGEKQKQLEERGGWLRSRVKMGMTWWTGKTGKKTLKGMPLTITLVAPRGRVEPNDPALDKETSIRGYTQEQVENSTIPRLLFKPHTVYALDKTALREYLDAGHSIPGVKLVEESGLRISMPGEK
jgi:hypothetical protein